MEPDSDPVLHQKGLMLKVISRTTVRDATIFEMLRGSPVAIIGKVSPAKSLVRSEVINGRIGCNLDSPHSCALPPWMLRKQSPSSNHRHFLGHASFSMNRSTRDSFYFQRDRALETGMLSNRKRRKPSDSARNRGVSR